MLTFLGACETRALVDVPARLHSCLCTLVCVCDCVLLSLVDLVNLAAAAATPFHVYAIHTHMQAVLCTSYWLV